MKKILLISNHAHHYRLKIYDYFYRRFLNNDYEFVLLTESIDKVDFKISYRVIVEKQNIIKYKQIIDNENPSAVIIFLHLKDIVNYPLSIYCKFKSIPTIFWNKGIDIKTPNSKIKNQAYYFLHDIADAIVLYTPNEIKFIKNRNRHKVLYGYNTLSFEGLDREKVPGLAYVKSKYNITQDNIVLFAATIKDDKKLDELLNTPCNDKTIAVVIAGKGISDVQRDAVNKLDNYYYIGQVPYDDYEMNALFKASKFFTTPGDIGLAIVQALYWGKPIIVLDVSHSVEIYYLINNYNGYLAADMAKFWEFVTDLNNNDELYNTFSNNCLMTYRDKASIEKMYEGFETAINLALAKHSLNMTQNIRNQD